MPAKPFASGEEVGITAKHDTYGISFTYQNEEQPVGMVRGPFIYIHISPCNGRY